MGSFSDDMPDRFMVLVVNIIKLEKQLCKTYSGRHIYGRLFRAGLNQDKRQKSQDKSEIKTKDKSHKTKVKNKIQNSKFKVWLRRALPLRWDRFSVSEFQSFRVSEFQSFKVSVLRDSAGCRVP